MITWLGINSDSETPHLFSFPSLSDIEGIIFEGKKFLEKTAPFHSNRAKINSSLPPVGGKGRERKENKSFLFLKKEQ